MGILSGGFMAETGSISAGLTTLTEVVTWISSQFTGMVSTITQTPILLLSVGIFATGAVIGLAHRLIRG